MSELRKRLPPGEAIRWISTTPAGSSATAHADSRRELRLWVAAYVIAVLVLVPVLIFFANLTPLLLAAVIGLMCVGLLFLVYEASDTEVAVLAEHVVWKEGGEFAWVLRKGFSKVRLDSIHRIDVEEGDRAVTLHCGDESHRIEVIAGGDLVEMARATGRPSRIWRRCMSPAADKGRRLRRSITGIFFFAAYLPLIIWFMPIVDALENLRLEKGWEWLLIVVVATVYTIVAREIRDIAGAILPHLLAGRSLTAGERRDFVGTLADLRWDGVQCDEPEDWNRPYSRLQTWAMYKAYGEFPEYPAYEPETIMAKPGGEFSSRDSQG